MSVVVLTYGHEDYIEQALESILMQKVNFKYEIIVGEDCSPDNTRKILMNYELKYPEKFSMIYRDKNIGAHDNAQDLYKRCRGKYIAYLEGDDYWISDNKLQMQVDYLESHEDFIATAHRVVVVDEHGNIKNDECYPECKDEVYTLKHYQKGLLPGQSATLVYRNIFMYQLCDISIFVDKTLVPGDRVKAFVLASHGGIYCFPKIMSAYRHVTTHGTSYSATVQKRNGKDCFSIINYYNTILVYAKKYTKNLEAVQTAESLYFWNVVRVFMEKKIKRELLMKIFNKIEYKKKVMIFVMRQIVSWPIRRLRYMRGGSI